MTPSSPAAALPRLSSATLDALPPMVARPVYERGDCDTGIVHIGIGAFHRGHQADYIDRILAAGDRRWGIVGASLRSPAVRDRLRPQDGLYTLIVRDGADERRRIIGAVGDVLVGPENPAVLVAALAAPSVRIVTLTITEKGYGLDPQSGRLDLDAPDIAADLAAPELPRTAMGFLFAGLKARKAAGLKPFTVLSCDNLTGNGVRTRAALMAYAERADAAVADWLAAEGAFPSAMVDRIVPATTEADIARLAEAVGLRDEALVKTEPFTQWVVEDRFCAGRPDLEGVGVEMTRDVAPWEQAKLRLLNGSHSAMAYLGGLSGLDFIYEAIGNPVLSAYVDALWDEASATLHPQPGLDIPAYRKRLRTRFANVALEHRTRQVAMDGSQKLPQRLLNVIRDRLAAGADSPALMLAVAAWMRWQFGSDEQGRAHVVDDPLAGRTRALIDAAGGEPKAVVAALLSLREVFGDDLAVDPRLRDGVTAAFESLVGRGALAAATAVAEAAKAPS